MTFSTLSPSSVGKKRRWVELHVSPVGEHGDDRRVRRRTTDAEAFELLDEARLGESRRRLGEVLARRDRLARHPLADLDDRKRLLVLERPVLAVLAAFAIENEEALELHDRAGGAEQVAAPADATHDRQRLGGRLVLGLDDEVDRGRVEDRGRHLRRHEALPDQL